MLPVAGFLNLCLLYCKAFPDKELRMTSSFPNRTLGQSVLVSAAQYASRPAVVTEVGTLTYEHLARLIDAFATNLAVRGVDSSSFCAVAGADPMITLMSYFAASALGARWTTGISDDEIARQVGVTHVILPETIEASVSVGHRIDVDQTWSARPPQFGVGSDIPFAETTGLDDDWVIAPTSGTTGNSKLVAISQRAMLKRAQALSGHFGEPECLLGSLMPVTSFPFLSRILPVFLAGGVHCRGAERPVHYRVKAHRSVRITEPVFVPDGADQQFGTAGHRPCRGRQAFGRSGAGPVGPV